MIKADCAICGKYVDSPFANGWRACTAYDDQPELNGWWCDTCSEQMDQLESHEDPYDN